MPRPQDIRGRDGAKQYVAALRAGFPDLHLTIEDQIAEGDMVVTRWTARGTHTGEFQGIRADRQGRSAWRAPTSTASSTARPSNAGPMWTSSG